MPAVRALRAFLTGVVAVVGLATLVGLLDRLWWVFETADVFRRQYLVVLVAAGLVALIVRRPRLAGLVSANLKVGNTDFAAVERLVAQTHLDLFGVDIGV